MGLELSPEEQDLQELMDKISNEIYSQLGIPEWKAESAVKMAMIAHNTYVQEKLKEEK